MLTPPAYPVRAGGTRLGATSTPASIVGVDVVVSRSGWSIQGGVELFVGVAGRAESVWDAIVDAELITASRRVLADLPFDVEGVEGGEVFELSGRVALVTGAGQNVGAGIARLLAAQGAAVAVNDLRRDRAEATVAGIGHAGGRAAAVAFDVTDLDAVRAGVAETEAALGPVDILVNNAGNGGEHGMVPTRFHESDPASWAGPIDVNLHGVLHCCHTVIGGMRERGWGRVITIASGAGMVGLGIGVSPYAAGKGGAIAFMRHLAVENAAAGVTANTLAIGLMGNPDPTVTEALARQIPVKRTGTPDDIGYACVYLASPEASWMTGQTIQINGGSVTT